VAVGRVIRDQPLRRNVFQLCDRGPPRTTYFEPSTGRPQAQHEEFAMNFVTFLGFPGTLRDRGFFQPLQFAPQRPAGSTIPGSEEIVG